MKIVQWKTIVSKTDSDRIFSMARSDWEAYAKSLVTPEGWKVRLDPVDSGTSIFAEDLTTGTALTIRPYYDNFIDPPEVLFVVRHYPQGKGPKFTTDFKRDLEYKAVKDLGSQYSVSVAYTKSPPFEEIELIIKRVS